MTIKTTTKALLGTAVSIALLGTAGVAGAADLDNLSDDELLARIERLEKIIGPGTKYGVRSGNSRVRVTLNGQINQAARFVSDGEDKGVQFVDNDASSTRFRILGAAKLNDRFSAKTNIEIDLESNVSSQIDLNNEDDGEDVGSGAAVNVDLRKLEFVVVDKVLGAVSLGQGDTSSNGVIERDLSGTSVVRDATNDDGNLDFRLAGGAFSGIDIGDVFPSFDGNGRDNRVRYDSPRYYGFSLGTSFETRGRYDVTLDYKTKDLHGFAISSRLAYFVNNAGDSTIGAPFGPGGNGPSKDTNIAGSISFLHKATGLSITGAAGENLTQDIDVAANVGDEESFWFIRGGYQNKFFDFGKTAFSASYYNSSNVEGSAVAANVLDLDGEWYDFNVVQKVDKLSAELYASFIRYEVDLTTGGAATPTQAINVAYAGARFKF